MITLQIRENFFTNKMGHRRGHPSEDSKLPPQVSKEGYHFITTPCIIISPATTALLLISVFFQSWRQDKLAVIDQPVIGSGFGVR